MKLIYSIIIISLLFLHSTDSAKSNTTICDSTVCYFPLEVGNYWIYYPTLFDSNLIVTKSIFDTTSISDTLYYLFGTEMSSAQLIRSDSSGRIYKRFNNKEVLWFDFALPNDSSYHYDIPLLEDWMYFVTIERDISVDTYAGRFENCILLFFDIADVRDDEHLYYFAPGIGIIAEFGNTISQTLYSAKIDSQIVTKVNYKDIQTSLFRLNQNHPNPFNPTTTISYQLPVTSNVELTIFCITGQKITTLVSEQQQAGNHRFEWDGSDFTSGVYFYRLSANNAKGEGMNFVETKKLILLK